MPPGRASVSLAQYLASGDEPDRARLAAFARYAGIASDDIVDERYLHRMTTVSAIATAASGGLAGRPPIAVPDRDGVFVVGDWVGSTGHLADAVLASARSCCRRGDRPCLDPATGPMTVDGDQARFDAERRRLTSLAYRMTGTPDDADDVVQEVWIRWQRTDRSAIDNEAAWLTTVTTRVAIDRLTSAQARRELYVGPWVPEPMADSSFRGTSADPAEVVASSDSLTLGFLRVLETLDPTERAVFLLHDVFAVPFAEVAAAVGSQRGRHPSNGTASA